MSSNREINFNTGILTETELGLILDALPVDITFVGKNDEVKYFNKLKTRIFKRSTSVIGLNVEKCHPEKSLSRVKEIFESFKAKSMKVAEFWINLENRLIYIRYFPVYNGNDYLGCLEVSQDITDIKKIKGEKRLI